jgi:NAD(P) transhydrogenase
VRTEAVLVAAGRRSNTECLNLDAAGLAPGDRGDLKVDEHYRTAVPHIYAAGDVIGFPGLASTGMQQARRAMSIAFGGATAPPTHDILPSAVYTIPEVAMAGGTEEAVHATGVDYVIGRARYADNPRGCIIGEKEGFLKLIFRREDLKLLGVHAIGELASELVHIGLIAMPSKVDPVRRRSALANNGRIQRPLAWRKKSPKEGQRTAISETCDKRTNHEFLLMPSPTRPLRPIPH